MRNHRISSLHVAIVAVAVLLFTYFFPRFVVGRLGAENPWSSYLYQYGFGLVTFLIGLGLIIRTGACQLGRGRDSFWFKVLLFGIVFFACLHAVWILAALKIPFGVR
jgi:hypothetical protein